MTFDRLVLLTTTLSLSACFTHRDGVRARVTITTAPHAGTFADSEARTWTVRQASVSIHSLTLAPCDSDDPFVTVVLDTHNPSGSVAVAHEGTHEDNAYGETHIATRFDLTTAREPLTVEMAPPATELCSLIVAFDDEAAFTLDADGPTGTVHTTTPGPATQTYAIDPSIRPTHSDTTALDVDLDLARWLGAIDASAGPLLALHELAAVEVPTDAP